MQTRRDLADDPTSRLTSRVAIHNGRSQTLPARGQVASLVTSRKIGRTMKTSDTRVPASQLAAFIDRAFTAAGLPENDAETLASFMVKADLRGSDTHGVIRLPLMCAHPRRRHQCQASIRVTNDRPSAALIGRRQRQWAIW